MATPAMNYNIYIYIKYRLAGLTLVLVRARLSANNRRRRRRDCCNNAAVSIAETAAVIYKYTS